MRRKTVAVNDPHEAHPLPGQEFDDGSTQTAGADNGDAGLEQTFLPVDTDGPDIALISLRNLTPCQQCQRVFPSHLTTAYCREQAQAISFGEHLIERATHTVDHQYMDFIDIDP